ncbi:MAG: hypothetical protein JWM16_3580, partial [Verrucomicrobiales bacterium]|nr:hypothetical protein [Verrucomicrobiales bacterium]
MYEFRHQCAGQITFLVCVSWLPRSGSPRDSTPRLASFRRCSSGHGAFARPEHDVPALALDLPGATRRLHLITGSRERLFAAPVLCVGRP